MLVNQGDIVYVTYDDFEIEYTTLIMGTSTFNQEKFSVSTEATKFQTGNDIRIFGTVSEFNYGKPVIIKILDPSDEPILVERIEVSPDKKFDITISETVGILWESSGTYSVIAQYDPKFESTLTTFEFYSTNWIVPQEAITINTDKTSYMFGEKIMVTGLIRDPNPHHTVDLTLTVNNQNGIIVTKILFPPNDDGSFSSEIITNASQWKKIGEYVLIVSYEGHSSSKTFLISDTN